MHTAKNAETLDSILTNLGRNSDTTTPPKTANLPIGTGLSSLGLATLRTFAQNKPDAEAINKQLLASLKSDFGSQIACVATTNKDYEVTGYQISLKTPLSEPWLKAIEYYNQPARGDLVAFEVTRLRSLTAKRKEGEFDMELSIEAITEELRDYPEDVVRTVCRDWARKNVFFPVLKELIDRCESLMVLRRALLNQGKEVKWLEHRKRDPEYTPPDEIEKQKVSSIMSEIMKNLNAA